MEENSLEPQVGLIAANEINRHGIKKVLVAGGYRVVAISQIDNLKEQVLTHDATVDVWMLDLKDLDIQLAIDVVIELSNKPLLVNDEVPASIEEDKYSYWMRRLLEKLEIVALPPLNKIEDDIESSKNRKISGAAEKVWLLAASLGGPDAVSRFLKALPPSLQLAVVYAQHTQTNFDEQLVTTIGKTQSYPVQLLDIEQVLIHGNVYVVPVNRQIRFLPFGRVVSTRKPWEGLYQPAIDQVIAELARLYRSNLGVIVFSGMCSDGEIGVRVAKACGCTVWAQTPESSTSPDMPQSAINTGCVSQQGTPEELAQLLVQHCDTYSESKLLSVTAPSTKRLNKAVNTKFERLFNE